MLNALLEDRARRRIHRICLTRIDRSAKVDYRQIGSRPPRHLDIGAGSVFQAVISADRAEAAVSVGTNTFVGASHLVCAERITIGNDVLISWGCTIVDHDSHAVGWDDRACDVPDYYRGHKDWSKVRVQPVHIRDKAWIGFNATILRGVTVGEGSVVGCCSVVTKDVPPYCLVAGNPARVIRKLDHEH